MYLERNLRKGWNWVIPFVGSNRSSLRVTKIALNDHNIVHADKGSSCKIRNSRKKKPTQQTNKHCSWSSKEHKITCIGIEALQRYMKALMFLVSVWVLQCYHSKKCDKQMQQLNATKLSYDRVKPRHPCSPWRMFCFVLTLLLGQWQLFLLYEPLLKSCNIRYRKIGSFDIKLMFVVMNVHAI